MTFWVLGTVGGLFCGGITGLARNPLLGGLVGSTFGIIGGRIGLAYDVSEKKYITKKSWAIGTFGGMLALGSFSGIRGYNYYNIVTSGGRRDIFNLRRYLYCAIVYTFAASGGIVGGGMGVGYDVFKHKYPNKINEKQLE